MASSPLPRSGEEGYSVVPNNGDRDPVYVCEGHGFDQSSSRQQLLADPAPFNGITAAEVLDRLNSGAAYYDWDYWLKEAHVFDGETDDCIANLYVSEAHADSLENFPSLEARRR